MKINMNIYSSAKIFQYPNIKIFMPIPGTVHCTLYCKLYYKLYCKHYVVNTLRVVESGSPQLRITKSGC